MTASFNVATFTEIDFDGKRSHFDQFQTNLATKMIWLNFTSKLTNGFFHEPIETRKKVIYLIYCALEMISSAYLPVARLKN